MIIKSEYKKLKQLFKRSGWLSHKMIQDKGISLQSNTINKYIKFIRDEGNRVDKKRIEYCDSLGQKRYYYVYKQIKEGIR